MSAMTSTPTPLNHASLDAPLALLGGLSPQQFMRRHWQKKPLLIRQALPGVQPPIDRSKIFARAAEEDVEAAPIVQAVRVSW